MIDTTKEIKEGELLPNAPLQQEAEDAAESSYTLRPLVASDMGAICKIITAIGIRKFKECFNVEDFKEGNIEKAGMGVAFDIAGIIIENIPKAEADINRFLASLTGLKEGAIYKLPFAVYGELIVSVVMKEDFRDFFKRVMKLLNR